MLCLPRKRQLVSSAEIERFELDRELTKGEEKLFNSDGIKPTWQPLRDEVLTKLMEERPDADTLTLLTLERVSFLYAKMRQTEATDISTNDQKLFMSMYNELINALNKIDEKQQSLENMRAEAVQMMVETLAKATSGLPESQRQEVMSKFVSDN